MKRLLFLCLFVLGIILSMWNFPSLAKEGKYDSIVVDFREDITSIEVREGLKEMARQFNLEPALNSIFSITDNVYIVPGDKNLLNTLRQSPLKQLTEFIEPNYIYQTLLAPNDPDYPRQWNLRSINVETAWEESKGEGVTVAVIDTGVSRVPDLQNTKFVQGYDFVNDRTDANDDMGHGTHVAGTIAQSTNNKYGVAGIAYQSKIMPIKVLSGSGGGTIADIAEGIRFAADNGAGVINMSLGGPGESKLLAEAIDYAYDKGVVIVAAAGNEGRNAASYPARYPKVISVAALDAAGKKPEYSNFGAGVDISAPGGSESGKILQNTIDPSTGEGIFEGFIGTSMAAPHVSGVAAMIKATGISQPSEVLEILKQSARKVDEDPLNYYGAGQLDAGAALKLAIRGQISFHDFFRFLRDNGYLSPGFWIDGGAVALLPKIAMVIGSYILAWFLRNYLPMTWGLSMHSGLLLGSSGLFFLQGFYIFDLPQWPFRVLGSSVTELGNSFMGSTMLNPLFASVLIPFILIALLLSHPQGKWWAVAVTLGVASALIVDTVTGSPVWFPMFTATDTSARIFLGTNALACIGLAYLAISSKR